jgi:colanic acid biosynthesis glycosyl transferase WcaI
MPEPSKPLNYLVSSINFAPDHAGIALFSTDFPVYLAEQNESVSMVTGFSYYPRWEKREQDKGHWFGREIFKGVKVFRGYLYVPKQVSTIKRLCHELSFCLSALVNFFRAGRSDAIVVFTPPFFLAFVGVLMKWIWRCPLVINIQDLPLDAAVSLGMIKSNGLSKGMQRFEAWLYRQADLVVTISPVMLETVEKKGVDKARLMLCPNWIDVKNASQPTPKGQFIALQPQAQNKFNVAYAGNLGIKQGVDVLLKAARELQTSKDFHFFVIGDGADKSRLLHLAQDLALDNVTFLPFMNPADYQSMLADIDVMFIAQRSEAGNNFFPSKLLGLMAQSKPLLVAADAESELVKVISNAGCGVISAYDDVTGLAGNLIELKALGSQISDMGNKGYIKVLEYDRDKVLGMWCDRIKELIRTQNK